MKIHLDSLDSFYLIDHEAKEKPKTKDYAGIGAIVFTFTVLSIVIVLSIYTAWQIAYGFVDGNNNGRDDVQEWMDSSDYRLNRANQPADKLNRHLQCDVFHGSWNNTGDGSCKYTQGNNTCMLFTNGTPNCVPSGQITFGAEDNQSQSLSQFQNIMKRLIQERLGLTNMQDIQNFLDQYQSQNNKDPDDITVYLCVQVDKNSTERVCKYWNNDELRPVILKIMREDVELNNLLRQTIQDSFNKAFNKSQNYSSEK